MMFLLFGFVTVMLLGGGTIILQDTERKCHDLKQRFDVQLRSTLWERRLYESTPATKRLLPPPTSVPVSGEMQRAFAQVAEHLLLPAAAPVLRCEVEAKRKLWKR